MRLCVSVFCARLTTDRAVEKAEERLVFPHRPPIFTAVCISRRLSDTESTLSDRGRRRHGAARANNSRLQRHLSTREEAKQSACPSRLSSLERDAPDGASRTLPAARSVGMAVFTCRMWTVDIGVCLCVILLLLQMVTVCVILD